VTESRQIRAGPGATTHPRVASARRAPPDALDSAVLLWFGFGFGFDRAAEPGDRGGQVLEARRGRRRPRPGTTAPPARGPGAEGCRPRCRGVKSPYASRRGAGTDDPVSHRRRSGDVGVEVQVGHHVLRRSRKSSHDFLPGMCCLLAPLVLSRLARNLAVGICSAVRARVGRRLPRSAVIIGPVGGGLLAVRGRTSAAHADGIAHRPTRPAGGRGAGRTRRRRCGGRVIGVGGRFRRGGRGDRIRSGRGRFACGVAV
jgi:hypothetical protein